MDIKRDGISANAGRLLWAGFFAILAAGIGFGIRGGIVGEWRAEFGFSDTDIGSINGMMFTGFCCGIIVGGLVCDRIGYGKLVIAAFGFHAASAVMVISASPDLAPYQLLYWGTFVFGLANGTLEAVANPLVVTLFPTNRTHYLNILHASWPAGLVIGSFCGWMLGDSWNWRALMALFLIPTVFYGLMFLRQHMPRSEASEQGVGVGGMLRDVGIFGGAIVSFLLWMFFANALALPSWLSIVLAVGMWISIGGLTKWSPGAWLLFVLFIAHALVGAVELGTDAWIQNITGNFLTSDQGKLLFVFTSAIMFSLRFCADFIERRLGLSPVGILLACSVLACVGLNLASGIETFYGAMFALAVYAIGKTFFWPTLLAVASDRFPRTGAVAISFMGGIGMMSAGLIGAPGLGYAKDRFAGAALEQADAAVYAEYKAEKPSRFLTFLPLGEVYGIDGKKLEAVQSNVNKARESHDDLEAARATLPPAEQKVHAASIEGDRKTLVADSAIPAVMAVIFLLLALYFRSIGGYRALHIDKEE